MSQGDGDRPKEFFEEWPFVFAVWYVRGHRIVTCKMFSLTQRWPEAEDAMQFGATKIAEKQGEYHFENFQAFLGCWLTISRNYALRIKKREKKKENWAMDAFQQLVAPQFDEEVFRRKLYLMIDKLPEHLKQVALLYSDGMKQQQIADRLQITRHAVRKLLAEALAILIRLFADDDG